jgi:Xaa-Pro aminopeptidase
MEDRVNRLKKLMNEEGLEGLLIDSAINRYYLTGFTGTTGRVLITNRNNYFITDFRYSEQAREEIREFEILEINKKQVEEIAKKIKKEGIKHLGFESRVVSYHQFVEYSEQFSGIELIPTLDLVAGLRLLKDQDEIERVKKAVEITDQAFAHICSFIKPGLTEREVALELEFFLKRKGAERNAFDFIVASGKRSSLPHGIASNKRLEKGDFITMDFGAVYQGYCSDMTRTVILGKPDHRQREIYNLVLRAQLEVIHKVRPGMECKEADALARDIITAASYGRNFGHSLGHGVGLEIHENPRVSYNSEEVLKSGMLITDEPGIYIPDWGGVRIEDDLLMTENGCEVLNSSPKELIIL